MLLKRLVIFDHLGDSAAHIAAMKSADKVLTLLVMRGADMNLRNRAGYSVLDLITNPATRKKIDGTSCFGSSIGAELPSHTTNIVG